MNINQLKSPKESGKERFGRRKSRLSCPQGTCAPFRAMQKWSTVGDREVYPSSFLPTGPTSVHGGSHKCLLPREPQPSQPVFLSRPQYVLLIRTSMTKERLKCCSFEPTYNSYRAILSPLLTAVIHLCDRQVKTVVEYLRRVPSVYALEHLFDDAKMCLMK